MSELNRWVTMAVNHWKEHQPKRYAELRRSGRLQAEALAAARMTADEMRRLQDSGASHEEAWEATRELHLFPPEEPNPQDSPPASVALEAVKDVNELLRYQGCAEHRRSDS